MRRICNLHLKVPRFLLRMYRPRSRDYRGECRSGTGQCSCHYVHGYIHFFIQGFECFSWKYYCEVLFSYQNSGEHTSYRVEYYQCGLIFTKCSICFITVEKISSFTKSPPMPSAVLSQMPIPSYSLFRHVKNFVDCFYSGV